MKKEVNTNFIFTHGSDKNERRFTLATKLSENGFSVGTSVCSHSDNFCRKIGRNIAIDRASGRPFSNVLFTKDQTFLNEKERRNFVIEQMFGIKKRLEIDATAAWVRNQN